MEGFITVIHYMLCIFMIIVILLQVGKGADIGAAFGAGGSQTLFGPRGAATFLNKLTAVVAIAFLATSMTLSHYSKQHSNKSVFSSVPVTPETAPAETLPSETKPAKSEGAEKK